MDIDPLRYKLLASMLVKVCACIVNCMYIHTYINSAKRRYQMRSCISRYQMRSVQVYQLPKWIVPEVAAPSPVIFH